MSDSRAAANQEQRTKNSQNPNLTNIMNTKKILALLISGVFATTMASQGAVITMPSGLQCRRPVSDLSFVDLNTTTETSTDINTSDTLVDSRFTAGRGYQRARVEGSTTWTAWVYSYNQLLAITTSTTAWHRDRHLSPKRHCDRYELHRICGMRTHRQTCSTLTSGAADLCHQPGWTEPMVTDQQAMTLSVPQHREFGKTNLTGVIRG